MTFATGVGGGIDIESPDSELGELDRLCHERREKPVSDLEAYLWRVRAVVMSTADRLTPRERDEIEHLIEHGEPAEGMRALAWILVEGDKKVPPETIAALRELTAGMIEEEDMPPELDQCIER
jgi:hypothetical protein